MISHQLAFVISNVAAAIVALGLAHALFPGRTRSARGAGDARGISAGHHRHVIAIGGDRQSDATWRICGIDSRRGCRTAMARQSIGETSALRRPLNLIASRRQNPHSAGDPHQLIGRICQRRIQSRLAGRARNSFPTILVITAPTVARWVQEGRFSYVTRNLTAYYPFNSELLSLWYTLPFHSDAWAALSGLIWLGLIAAAAAALGRKLGLAAASAALVAVLTICSPEIVWQVRTFSPTDLAAASLILAGIYFAAVAIGRDSNGAGTSEALYAGLLIGAAVGCKVTVAPVALVVFLSLLVRRPRQKLDAPTPLRARLLPRGGGNRFVLVHPQLDRYRQPAVSRGHGSVRRSLEPRTASRRKADHSCRQFTIVSAIAGGSKKGFRLAD